MATIVGWLSAQARSIASRRERIEALERQAIDAERHLDRHHVVLERVAVATSPQWLRVAINDVEQYGGRIDLVPDGLRVVSADRTAVWTLPLLHPVDALTAAVHHKELHRRLGMDQRTDTAALVGTSSRDDD